MTSTGVPRALRLVVLLALLLAAAGCGGSEVDPPPAAEYGTSLTIVKDLDRL